MEFEDEPELEGFAAPPAPCRPLRWPERAYLEAELAELDGFAPPVPRRPLRWLAPERLFEVEICWVLCVRAQCHSPRAVPASVMAGARLPQGGARGARRLRAARAAPASAMAGAGTRLLLGGDLLGSVCVRNGIPHAPCRPLRWLAPERDYFKAEFAKLAGIAAPSRLRPP